MLFLRLLLLLLLLTLLLLLLLLSQLLMARMPDRLEVGRCLLHTSWVALVPFQQHLDQLVTNHHAYPSVRSCGVWAALQCLKHKLCALLGIESWFGLVEPE